MDEEVKIVECPRDAWQGLPGIIPPEVKADYLRKLIDAGFRHHRRCKFRLPCRRSPDGGLGEVLSRLSPPADVEIIGIVVNEKGALRAIETDAVRTLGFPYSISPEFLRRNQNQTLEESLEILQRIQSIAAEEDRNVVAYLSMAFGNPYGDAWSVNEVLQACDLIADCGVTEISLADTVGLADA